MKSSRSEIKTNVSFREAGFIFFAFLIVSTFGGAVEILLPFLPYADDTVIGPCVLTGTEHGYMMLVNTKF